MGLSRSDAPCPPECPEGRRTALLIERERNSLPKTVPLRSTYFFVSSRMTAGSNRSTFTTLMTGILPIVASRYTVALETWRC